MQDHLDGADEQHQQEDQPEQLVADAREQACSDQCADENTQRDRSRDQRGNVPTREIDARTGRRRDPNHKIGGGCTDLDRQPHQGVQRDDLKGSAANAQEAGDQAGDVHYGQSPRRAGHLIRNLFAQLLIRIGAVKVQSASQAIIDDSLR